jgi:hypothetical protein
MAKLDPFSTTFDDHLAASWEQASPEVKEDTIARVATNIDRWFNFRGARANKSQGQAWPRTAAAYDDGRSIEGVPREIREATSFYAGCVVAGYRLRHPKVLARLLLILEPVMDPDAPFRGNLRPL